MANSSYSARISKLLALQVSEFPKFFAVVACDDDNCLFMVIKHVEESLNRPVDIVENRNITSIPRGGFDRS